MKISDKELFAILSGISGAKILSFIATTDADLRKTSKDGKKHDFGQVWKTNHVNAMVNFHYDLGVLRRLEKEGKSELDFRRGTSWHEPVLNDGKLTPFARHKKNGNFYLRVMWLGRIGIPVYLSDTVGELLEEQIKPWMKPESTYENQGLDAPLRFNIYGLDKINELTLDGVTYVVNRAA